MLTPEEFKATIIDLANVLPKFAPNFADREIAKSYYLKVRDMDFGELRKACQLAADTRKEFPAIADLRELMAGNTLTDDEVAMDLATKIERWIGLYGRNVVDSRNYYHDEWMKNMGELGLEVAKEFGGWQPLCMRVESSFELKQFREDLFEVCKNKYKKLKTFGKDEMVGLPKAAQEKHPALTEALNLIRLKG